MKHADIAKLDAKGLTAALNEARTELVEKQRGLRSGELQNPRAITELRKRIARILTVMNQKTNEDKEVK